MDTLIVAALDLGARHGDLALWDGAELHLSKHPLAAQTAEAAFDVLSFGLAQANIDLGALDELRLCQTWALNAVLTRSALPVTLITTRGFGDVLTLARQDRADLYDPVARSDAPGFLVDKVIELDERIDAAGDVVTPPDLSSLLDVDDCSVSVCLLNAHLNGRHERAVAAKLAHVSVVLSHLTDPAPREYERTVATCLEAWLRGALATTLNQLQKQLIAGGFRGRLLLADGRGMLPSSPTFLDMIAAGPAMAAATLHGFDFLGPAIAADLGSCSLDLSFAQSGQPVSRTGNQIGGVPLRQVMVDTHSAPLGGQTCPLSEGPTVDDALSALGRLPGTEAGQINAKTAQDTIGAMAQCVRDQIIEFAVARNLDPFHVPLVLMGGLGMIMATDIAEALGLRRIHLAPAPALAGAVALLSSPEVIRRRCALPLLLSAQGPDGLGNAISLLRKDPPPGFIEVWAAEIAPSALAEAERVPLDAAPSSAQELLAQWQGHMDRLTGVRPKQGALQGLELAFIRKPAQVSPAQNAGAAPDGWRSIALTNGGTRLERLT